jgi:iron complex transport system permease protein
MISILASDKWKWIGLAAAAAIFICFFISNILFGLTNYSWQSVINAYLHFDGSNAHLIIKAARVPRALIAAAVGASLAVAGALMQALTRNPLASPGIFGVNAGAALFIVAGVTLFNMSSAAEYAAVAFIGAGVVAAFILALGSLGRGGMTPVKITLAGAAIAAFASSITQGVLLVNGKAFDQVLYWLVGSVAGRDLSMLIPVVPYIAAAGVAAIFIAKPINILIMGEDVARGLGQRTVLVKLAASVIIVLLAGGSVAVAGPIGFIGIIIPHIARYFVGNDHRWLLPYCAVMGAILLLAADLAARFVLMPKELPVGVLTALLGVPFFIAIARRRNYV